MHWLAERININQQNMAELIPVNILIGDRSYRIKTSPADEEIIRRTIKTINDKIVEFKTQFAGKDMQDYIAMVLIWYATQLGNGSDPGLQEEMAAALKKIEEQLDKAN
jgi:cell division protein ZapA